MFRFTKHSRTLYRLLACVVIGLMAGEVFANDHLPDVLPKPTGPVVLEIGGDIGRTNGDGRAVFDMAMLRMLPVMHIDTTTSVTHGVHGFDGFLVRDLLAWVKADGDSVIASALNDYIVDIDMEDFHDFDVIAAYAMDGQPLTPSDKGPLWIIYPRDDHAQLRDVRYDYRWVWQLNRLIVE